MAIYPTVQLDAPGLPPLVLDPSFGYFCQALDLGFPVVRVVAEDVPDGDGTIDTTQYFGARSVTLSVIIFPEPARTGTLDVLLTNLRAYTNPRRRSTMTFQRTATSPVQQITLRGSQFSEMVGDSPRAATQSDPEAQPVTVQWVAPSGLIESAELHETTISATGSAAVAGMVFPEVFPLVFPASTPVGAGQVVNAGTADVYPIIRIYGPCTNPVVTNVTQGKSLMFVGLTVLVGEYVEVDMRNHTIRYLGLASDSRQNTLSFPASSWFTLSPGVNEMLLQPATFTAPSSMAIIYRDGWA